jgi:hypothetical protein
VVSIVTVMLPWPDAQRTGRGGRLKKNSPFFLFRCCQILPLLDVPPKIEGGSTKNRNDTGSFRSPITAGRLNDRLCILAAF